MTAKQIQIVMAGLLGLAMCSGTAVAQNGPTYETVDYPGATATQLQGINPEGEIVGGFTDATGTHGFLLAHGRWTPINYPGAIRTLATGINPQGDIVGNFYSSNGQGLVPRNQHGFLLTDGTFTEIQGPGYMGTIAQRITPTGQIYGCVHNLDYGANMRGFARFPDGSWSIIDTLSSMSNGPTPDGSFIAGLFTDLSTGHTHGFIIRNGNFESFDVPGSILTQAWDASPEEQVVGTYEDAQQKVHGFLMSDGQFTTIDFPGATSTQVRGINPEGDIVGLYTAGGKTHGFLRTAHGRD